MWWKRSVRSLRAAMVIATLACLGGFQGALAATPVSVPDGDVYAMTTEPNGAIDLTVYTPAPGNTSKSLRAQLAAEGVPVVSPGAVVPAALPCSDGTARTLTCPPVTWPRNGYNHPQIYFLDHTSAAWPITAVVPEWNLAHGVDSWYRWYTQGCPGGGTHCVNVYNANYGPTGWTSKSFISYSGSSITGAYSELNDYYGGTAAEHRNSACNALGLDLGLGFNTSTNSCMYGAARTSQQYPDSNDFSMLHAIYPFA